MRAVSTHESTAPKRLRKRGAEQPEDRDATTALALQRTAGNAAVATLMRQTHAPPKPKHDPAADQRTAQVVADVLQHRSLRLLGQAAGEDREAILALHAAITGKRDGKPLSGEQCLAALEGAQAKLAPVLHAVESDDDGKAWVATEVTPYLAPLRATMQLQIARERVESAQLVGDKVIEVHEGDEKAERETLHQSAQKLISVFALLNEQLIRAGHDQAHHVLHHFLEEMKEGHKTGAYPKELRKEPGDPGFLLEIQNLLFFVDGLLGLSDEELARELAHPHSFAGGVATTAEFLKYVTEMFGGLLGISFSFAAVIARASGDAQYAAQAMGYARVIGLKLGNIVAYIEIAHGIVVLLDKDASDQKKVEAVRDIAAGSAWLVGSRVAGAAVGTAASFAIIITYKELELMADLYGKALTGIVGGWMSAAYETMADSAKTIGEEGRDLAKAGYLVVAERDPERHKALAMVEQEYAHRLGASVDYFLEQCEPVGYGPGAAYKPGAHGPLRKIFAPLLRLQGAKTPEATAAAATEVLKAIQYCFEHAQELLNEAIGRQPKAGGEHKGEGEKGHE